MVDIFSRTLITGAGGMVGDYINFGIKTNRKTLDINNPQNIAAVFKKYKPKVILHLAAETDVDLCEQNPQHAYFVNAVGTYNIANEAAKIGAKLIYVSTAGVFDGKKKIAYTEKDQPNPQNHYSRSKYLGEIFVRSLLKDYLIVRTGWVFGGGKKDHKFVGKIVNLLQSKDKIQVVYDTTGSPIYSKDLIEGIKYLIKKNKKGIVHLANKGSSNRFEMAKIIASVINPNAKIEKVASSTFKDLTVKRIASEAILTKVPVRGWEDALREYLNSEWKSRKIKQTYSK